MTDALSGFDSYQIRARIYPALLTLLPLVVAAYATLDVTPLRALAPLVVTAGGVYLLASLARGRGLRAQDRLIGSWGAMPTTLALRHTSATGAVLRSRRHQQLALICETALPTPDEEQGSPSEADERYDLAVRVLIARVRQASDRFPRVHEELTHYGFRRNLYGLRPVGLVASGAAAAWMLGVWLVEAPTVGVMAALAVAVVAIAVWAVVVTPAWVRQAGERYAERLFEALEDQELTRGR